MSSRIRTELGNLGDRVTRTPAAAGAKHCVVDGTYAGIVWGWRKEADGWVGWVAYVDADEHLHVGPLPAARLQPTANANDPRP